MTPATPHPSAEWEPLVDSFYRRHELYRLDQLDLKSRRTRLASAAPGTSGGVQLEVSSAKCGGPIAIVEQTRARRMIKICSASGLSILETSWSATGTTGQELRIVGQGWTRSQELVLVQSDGLYRIYDLQGRFRQHTLGNIPKNEIVASAKVLPNGLVALTGGSDNHGSGGSFLCVESWQGDRARKLAPIRLNTAPHAWDVLPADRSTLEHDQVQVIVAVGSSLTLLDRDTCKDQGLSLGPFTAVCVSPNGRLISLFTASAKVLVISSDFQRHLGEYDATSLLAGEGFLESSDMANAPPIQNLIAGRLEDDSDQFAGLEWCGNEAPVLAWGSIAVLIGPFAESLKFYYDSQIHLFSEQDGIRILSDSGRHDFLQKVDDASEQVFRIGSTSPAAILLDAWEQWERQEPRSDETLRSIQNSLSLAVDGLIEAAGFEWDLKWQQHLLRAAAYGKARLEMYDPNFFVAMTQKLRLINSVRAEAVGIPLTAFQYDELGLDGLMENLLRRHLYPLALEICQYLSLPYEFVIRHWATEKIKKVAYTGLQAATEAEIAEMIVIKGESLDRFGWSELAHLAWEKGLETISRILLDNDPRRSEQIPLLLTMNKGAEALDKACLSGDPNLIYHVLLTLKSQLSLGNFFQLMDTRPIASALLISYGRQFDEELLRDYLYQADRGIDNALLDLNQARKATTFEERQAALKKAKTSFQQDKETALEAKTMDDATDLLALQAQLDQEFSHAEAVTSGHSPSVAARAKSFLTLSLIDTCRRLLLLATPSAVKEAEKVRQKFKVSDRRWWYLRIGVCTERKDWSGLESLAKSKKSPIGYEPFVEGLFVTNAAGEISDRAPNNIIATILARCPAKDRVSVWLRAGEWVRATQEAASQKDWTTVKGLRAQAPNSVVQRELDMVIKQLGAPVV